MPDRIDDGFEHLRGARTPDLWERIEAREPARPPAEPGPVRRVLIATLALSVAAAGLGVGYLAFHGEASTGGTTGVDLPAPERIAFTASEPRPEPSQGPGNVSVGSSGEQDPMPTQIYTVNPNGSGLRRVTDDATLKGSLAWSPDASELAFTSYDLERKVEQLSVIAADGSERRLVCEACTGTFFVVPDDEVCFEVCSPPTALEDLLTWSPDGAWIAAPLTQDGGLALIEPTTGVVKEAASLDRVGGTSWSPDGRRLAVSVGGKEPGLWIVDAAENGAALLLAADPYGPPAWSPDGSTIAVGRTAKIGGSSRAELVFVNAIEGSERTVLGPDTLFELYDLEWSPDGTRLAVLHHPVDPPTAALLTVAADGSDPQMLALCENGNDRDGLCTSNGGGVSWSPDGSAITFDNYDGERHAFSVLTLGGTAMPISAELDPRCCIAWSPGAPARPEPVPPASPVETAPTPSPPPGWVSYQDPPHEFSVQYPAEWHRSEEPLTPDLVDPQEILALGTFDLRPGGPNCAHLPVQALTDLGPGDALVWLAERERGDVSSYATRPAAFGPTSGTDADESPDCLEEPKRFFHRWIAFQDEGRGFYILVAMGPDVSDETRQDAWAILDGLMFQPVDPG